MNKKREINHNTFNPFLQRQIQDQKNKGLELKKTVKVEVSNDKAKENNN